MLTPRQQTIAMIVAGVVIAGIIITVASVIYVHAEHDKKDHHDSPHDDDSFLVEYDAPPVDESVLDGEVLEGFRGGGRGGGRGGRGGRGPGRHGRHRGGMHPFRRRPWSRRVWEVNPQIIYTWPLTYYDNYQPAGRYSIRLGPKTLEHPFVNRGSSLGFMVNKFGEAGCGESGEAITLQYGRTYEFDIYTRQDCVDGSDRDEPFIFTTSDVGGPWAQNLFNVAPTTNGTIRVTMHRNLPSFFYYQSTNSRRVGGFVFLVDTF